MRKLSRLLQAMLTKKFGAGLTEYSANVFEYNNLGKAYFVAGFLGHSTTAAEGRNYLATQTDALVQAGMDRNQAASWTGELLAISAPQGDRTTYVEDRTNIWKPAFIAANQIISKYSVEAFSADDVISSLLLGISPATNEPIGNGKPAPYNIGASVSVANATPQSLANLLKVQAVQQTEAAAKTMSRRRDTTDSGDTPLFDESSVTWFDVLSSNYTDESGYGMEGIHWSEVLKEDAALIALNDVVQKSALPSAMKEIFEVVLIDPSLLISRKGELSVKQKDVADVLYNGNPTKSQIQYVGQVWRANIKKLINLLRDAVPTDDVLSTISDMLGQFDSSFRGRQASVRIAKRVVRLYLNKTASTVDWIKWGEQYGLLANKEKYGALPDVVEEFQFTNDYVGDWDNLDTLGGDIVCTLEVVEDGSYRLYTGRKMETFLQGEEKAIQRAILKFLK